MKKKNIIAVVCCLVLMLGAVGATIAWLQAKSAPVTNTFTSAELFADPEKDFTLWEHEAVANEDGTYTLTATEVSGNTYDILPGVAIPKDPTVDVVGLQEYAYLFIKVTGLPMAEGLTATVDPANWTALGGGVYVYSGIEAENNIIKATDTAMKEFTVGILAGNQVVVADTYNGVSDDIKLSFEAYMVQATGNGADAAEAWANTYGKTTGN